MNQSLFGRLQPFRVGANETGARITRQEADELQHVSVRIPKVNLRGWHPSDYARLFALASTKPERLDALLTQSLYRSEQLIEGDCERDMAFSIYSALWAVNSVRSPQTNHSLLFLVRPKKNDVASRIAICKG